VSTAFFGELSTISQLLVIYRCQVVAREDLNIHVNQADDVDPVRINAVDQVVLLYAIIYRTIVSTHNAGHILDLVATSAVTATCELVS